MTGTDHVIVTIVAKPSWFVTHWVFTFICVPVIAIAAFLVFRKWRKGSGIITPTDIEKARLQFKVFKKNWSVFRQNRLGFGGLIVLMMFVIMAVFAPLLVTVDDPANVQEPNVRDPDGGFYQLNPLPPSLTPSAYTGQLHPLGTDHKGGEARGPR